MTLKNFLKTAVFGIALYSVFCINNSIAMNNNQVNENNSIEVYKQQLRDIFDKVYSYKVYSYNNDEGEPLSNLCIGMPMLADNIAIDPRTDGLIETVFSRITCVINKALYRKLDAIDLNILKDSIGIVKSNITTIYYNSNYMRDCNIISQNSNEIINAVSKIYSNTQYLT